MLSTRIYWILVLAFVGLVAIRFLTGDAELSTLVRHQQYHYEQFIAVRAAPGPYRLSMYIPRSTSRVNVAEESFESGDLNIDLADASDGRLLTVTGDPHANTQTVRYVATVHARSVSYDLDPGLRWGELEASPVDLEATDEIQVADPLVQETLQRILRIESAALGGEVTPSVWQAALENAGTSPVAALRGVFEFCHVGIEPATFSGTTDAVTALRLGESSCGGKSRAMIAMCRALGIPSRPVGGIILEAAQTKRTSHVWVECRLAGQWVAFDPLNGHFAFVPGYYLPLYRGDLPLLRYSRGLAVDYAFTTKLEKVPAAWMSDQREAVASHIPLLRRQQFSILLLAPFALMLTVFLRHVVGLDSIGTFLPVLLGFSIAQTGWIVGGVQLAGALALGIVVRFLLARLHLLHVPRTAILITLMVGLFMAFSVVLDRMEAGTSAGGIVLPMAALAMTVERYAFVAMDRGSRAAAWLLMQTFVIAAGCYVVLTTPFFKAVTVAFPEVLLLVVAQIIILGSYRGLRWKERWRFRHVPGAPAEVAR